MNGLDEVKRTHLIAEATKLAYAHRDAYISDPEVMQVAVEELLSEKTARNLRERIDPERASQPEVLELLGSEHRDTICLSVVDGEGSAISFINSLFHGFGSCGIGPPSGGVPKTRASPFRLG